jgi:hypothetical protein
MMTLGVVEVFCCGWEEYKPLEIASPEGGVPLNGNWQQKCRIIDSVRLEMHLCRRRSDYLKIENVAE